MNIPIHEIHEPAEPAEAPTYTDGLKRDPVGRVVLDLCDSSFAHCVYSNNPEPPTTISQRVSWNRDISALVSPCTFVTDNVIGAHFAPGGKRTVAWLLEPRVLKPALYDWVKENHRKFYAVLSHDVEFFGGNRGDFSPHGERISNFLWVPFGGCWIHEEEWWDPTDTGRPFSGFVDPSPEYAKRVRSKKATGISIVASGKTITEGHRMRHEVIRKCSDEQILLNVMGNGYRHIEHKSESMGWQFQLVFENDRKPGYFTEKLIDCLVSGVIPIYWGCPNLADYGFDEAGILSIDSLDDFFNRVLPTLGALGAGMDNVGTPDPMRLSLRTQVQSEVMAAARVRNAAVAKKFLLAEDYIWDHYGAILTA